MSDTDEQLGEISRPKATSPKRNYEKFKPKNIREVCEAGQIQEYSDKIIIDRFIVYNPLVLQADKATQCKISPHA